MATSPEIGHVKTGLGVDFAYGCNNEPRARRQNGPRPRRRPSSLHECRERRNNERRWRRPDLEHFARVPLTPGGRPFFVIQKNKTDRTMDVFFVKFGLLRRRAESGIKMRGPSPDRVRQRCAYRTRPDRGPRQHKFWPVRRAIRAPLPL